MGHHSSETNRAGVGTGKSYRISVLAALALLSLVTLAGEPIGVGPQSMTSAPKEEFDCIVEPSETVEIGSPSPGIIQNITVDRSDAINQGALIAELEAEVERIESDLARARYTLTTEMRLRQITSDFGQRQQQRNRDLYLKKAVSSQEMDKFETGARAAALEHQQALDKHLLAGLESKRSEAVLKRRKVYSPVTGIVMDRYKSAGEYVDDEPLLRIAKVDPLNVEVIAPVALISRILPGMIGEVTLDPEHLGKHRAIVSRVDRVADAASATFGVRLKLDNPEYKIPAGLRCRIVFDLDQVPMAERSESPEITPDRPAPAGLVASTPPSP